jgi:hypothetical protein
MFCSAFPTLVRVHVLNREMSVRPQWTKEEVVGALRMDFNRESLEVTFDVEDIGPNIPDERVSL